MPWLCIEEFHNKKLVSVYFHTKVEGEYSGKRTFIEISDAEAELSIDVLNKIYASNEALKGDAKVDVEGLAAKRASLMQRLIGIIQTSDQDGEVDNARRLFKKITGREYTKGSPP